MTSRSSALYQRTVRYRRGGSPWLGAVMAVSFALLPMGVMLWVIPTTGLGIA